MNRKDGKNLRTSQRAELLAVIIALNTVSKELEAKKLLISTNSQYVINSIVNRQKLFSLFDQKQQRNGKTTTIC